MWLTFENLMGHLEHYHHTCNIGLRILNLRSTTTDIVWRLFSGVSKIKKKDCFETILRKWSDTGKETSLRG